MTRLWQFTYRHDRRKHRHRCRVCRCIINEGQPVWMAKVANGKTWAMHEACAAAPHPCGTYLDAFKVWTSPCAA